MSCNELTLLTKQKYFSLRVIFYSFFIEFLIVKMNGVISE